MASQAQMLEMDRIRNADAELRSKQVVIPEKPAERVLGHFEVSRYTAGPSIGAFNLYMVTSDGPDRKPLKKPIRKRIAEGVTIDIVTSTMETALRRKVFK